MRKPKKPKPRNPVARDMIERGAFKQRAIPPKKGTIPRKRKHKTEKEDND